VSPKRLRGWEPLEVHTPVYDDAGRVTAVHVEREPEWTPDQVALVLGVTGFEQMLGPHGQPMDEATSPDADPSNPRGSHRYAAGKLTVTPEGAFVRLPIVDFAEKATKDAEDLWRKAAGENANPHGFMWPVEKVTWQ